MDIRKIKKLIELVESSGISELDITEGEESVRITRANQVSFAAQAPTVMPTPAVAAPATTVTTPAPASSELEHQGLVFKAPMVGTFYAASSPNDPALVSVGSSVKEGDVVCIIEAMKLFNQIDIDIGGTVKEILVENGQPVEYGQPLFILE